jgi:alpha-beta hydrolase superfamily lysophospholipase
MGFGRLLRATSRGTFKAALYLGGLAAAVLATIVVVFAVQARVRLPDLEPWHRIELAEEFRASRAGAPKNFSEYLALEERLFAELRRRVLDDPRVADRAATGRYNPAAVPAQLALGTRYNRSYELAPREPRGAVLLLHGLTDSPYSVRALAEVFHARGFYVLALRMPGHGTVPAGLLDTQWTDWYAAVEMAARHAARRAGGGPFYAGGYSTGAPLAALLAVRGLEDPTLPRPSRLFLVSAAIGVSQFAALANVASTLSFLPYFEKAKWLDVLPEYDPFKYNSFTVNAGNQVFQLTRALHRELAAAAAKGTLDRMPKVTAFQSVVDSTVNAAEVIRGFMLRLPGPGNELVAFDVNRGDDWTGLIAPGPREAYHAMRDAPALPFRLIALTNRAGDSAEVAALTREAGETGWRTEPLDLAWPAGVFSVGHVALPFTLDDPVYGLQPKPAGALAWTIGDLAARGEAGALAVPLGMFARLRSNPFFAVIRARVEAAIDADERR